MTGKHLDILIEKTNYHLDNFLTEYGIDLKPEDIKNLKLAIEISIRTADSNIPKRSIPIKVIHS